MPRLIDCTTDETMELADLIDLINTQGIDSRDEEAFASWGPALKMLGNNRRFLADIMIAELKQRCADQVKGNQYSAQVVMLHVGGNFFMRANLWPAEADTVVRQSGADPFFYNVPHDHNFSFLTVGYLGPGYWSDYYEYDYEGVTGFPGEPVDLQFVERSRLEQGKVMLYRAHRDIHLQLPADSLSVSLNIVETDHSTSFRDQYRFDLDTMTVAGIMTRTSLEPMLMLAAHHGGGNGIDLLNDFVARHPSDRVRWAALRARAGAAATLDERIGILERGTQDHSRLVAEMARVALEQLLAGRSWIESPPSLEEAVAA